jgi:hypothetical protein
MAIKLSTNYSKKLGLPGFSSHSFSVSLEVELVDLSKVDVECQKLYALLQQSVDREIQQVGFMPEATYGMPEIAFNNGTGNGNGHFYPSNGSGHRPARLNGRGGCWNCTEGQRGFILRILNENHLEKQQAEDLSQQLFSIGVRQLNKMQASQLIEELLALAGKPRPSHWRRALPLTPETTSPS